MDITEISRIMMEASFNEEYSKQKEAIISKLKSNPDSCELSLTSLRLDTILDIKDDPSKAPSPINMTNDGVEILSWNDEVIDELLNSIPSTIKHLTVSIYLIGLRPNLFERFPELEVVDIKGNGDLEPTDLQIFDNNKKLKNINTNMSIDDKFKYEKDINIKCGDKQIVQKGDLTITSRNSYMSDLAYNGPIENMSSFITPDSIDLERYTTSLYRNGKKVLDYQPKHNKLEVLLSEPIEGSYKLASEFIKSTGLECSSIELKTDNKTYSDLDSLYKFESLGNVEIDYGDYILSNIDQYIGMRANLDYFVMLINQNDLSPMEKLCYAYDLVKSHIYRENNDDFQKSRHIHNIVETGDIVCVGYSVFLAELLKEIGIDAHAIGTSVPLQDGETVGHERNIVEIHDEKYGIDGMFALDCTWDSNKAIYKIIRDGKEVYTKKLKEGDEILYTYDVMSSYNYFLIPAQEYEAYFPGESFHRDIKDWHGKEYDPNKAALDSLPELFTSEDPTDDKFEDAYLDEDTIISVIYNTRLYEGYSKEQNDRLIEEVKLIRDTRRPKSLRSEDGMTK